MLEWAACEQLVAIIVIPPFVTIFADRDLDPLGGKSLAEGRALAYTREFLC